MSLREEQESANFMRRFNNPGGGLSIRGVDLSTVEPIRWAWQGRLPLGVLSILLGAEGVGKSTLAAWLIARLTRGELPGNLAEQPVRCLTIGDEDSFDAVTVPRLVAAGADFDKVFTISEGDDLIDLDRDYDQLRKLLQKERFAVVYFDSLVDTLGADVDDWRAKDVREALRGIRRLAREFDLCVIGSLHPNKGQHATFRGLVSGSHQYNALARSSLLLAEHPDDADRRLLVRGKGNLSKEPPGFEFEIQTWVDEINGHRFELPVVAETGNCDYRVADVLKPERSASVRDSLAEQIDKLGTGEVQTRGELAKALGRKPDDRTVERALGQLEDEGRWRKVGRGKWQRFGIGTSKEVPIPIQPVESKTAVEKAGS